jgi:hypothetical protein
MQMGERRNMYKIHVLKGLIKKESLRRPGCTWILKNMAVAQDRDKDASPTIVRVTYIVCVYIFLCVYAPPIIDEWPPLS